MQHEQLAITIFSLSRIWGGAEEQTRLLAEGLRNVGHTCRFVTRRRGPVADRMQRAGFPTLMLGGTGRSPVSLWRARRHLRAARPHVVHFVDPHAVTSGGFASCGLNIPARLAVRHNPFPLRHAARYRWMCDRVICVCNAIAHVCRSSGLPESMLRVVPNGCVPAAARDDHERQRLRRQWQLSDDALVLLTAAHLNACKGHTYLLAAMPRILSAHPTARLVLAGAGPLEEELRRQAVQRGIADRVDFLGFRADVRQWMRAADLFVLPSLAEGISAVLLEAMFERCPIVTTSVGGTPELLSSGTSQPATAWLVPPADPQALCFAICEALAHRSERFLRAERAEQFARTQFTVDTMVARTLAVYREVIEEPSYGQRIA